MESRNVRSASGEAQSLTRFTVFAQWPSGEVEEIDVDAVSAFKAKEEALLQLEEGYEPGFKIIRTVPRVGGYF